MFCSNCGKQIPDNVKFCNYCGAQQQAIDAAVHAPQTAQNQQRTVDAQKQRPVKTQKKKPNIIVALAVVVCAFLLGKFLIAPSMTSDSGDGSNTGNQGSQSQQMGGSNGSSVQTANPAYEAIFDDTYIVHFQTMFNMEMKSFALKQADGIICCADYGYKDDAVKQWVETMYIPVESYTDTQKAELETTMKAQFAAVDGLNCCTVTYKMGTNYFTITCTYSDVDQPENYSELYNAQILQANTFISMSATETALLSQGFIKK